MKSDRLNPGVTLVLDKQQVINDIASMVKIGVITIADLEGFSEELINEVKSLTVLKIWLA